MWFTYVGPFDPKRWMGQLLTMLFTGRCMGLWWLYTNPNLLYDVLQFIMLRLRWLYFYHGWSPNYDDGIAGIFAGSFDAKWSMHQPDWGDDDINGIFETGTFIYHKPDTGTYYLVSSTGPQVKMGVYNWTFRWSGCPSDALRLHLFR